ncbi:MAG: hypothetical protein Q3962_06635 [Corynebacterium sp.]|nr:hypothetical protein [Corynebacterium sp.]
MAEKQLTVAELMARAQKEGRTTEPRRRRRRSAEEGGVSLAELTGSIPRVQSEGTETRHSHEASASNDAVTTANAEAEKVEAPKTEAPKVEGTQASVSTTPAPQATGSAPVTEPEKTEAPHSSEPQQKKQNWGVVADTDITQVTEAIDDEPDASAKAETPINTGAQPKAEPQPKTAEQPAVSVKERPKSDAAKVTAQAIAARKEAEEKARQEAEAKINVAAAIDASEEALEADQPLSIFDPDAPSEDAPEEHKTSVLAMIIMVVVGIIIGIVFFRGFMLLWDHFNPFITAILALAVVCGTVGVVHALHTERKRLTMVIAGIAALIVTVGPYWA